VGEGERDKTKADWSESCPQPAFVQSEKNRLFWGLSFAKTKHSISLFPTPLSFEQGNPFKAFQDVSFGSGGTGTA
jgi:hypothetical protein